MFKFGGNLAASKDLGQIGPWFAMDRIYVQAIFMLLASCILLATTGCGKKEIRLPTFKVSGKVTKGGVGLPNATVIFHAKQEKEGFIKPRATTDANGDFELTTYLASDGAPEGEYDVTISQWLAVDPAAGAKNQLPSELSVPATSKLKATVSPSDNTLPPFELP